jgi:putative ABC transport system substrate-binding protein
VAGVFAAISLVGCQKHETKTYVVGIINPSAGLADVVKGFKDGMEKRGYHEGKNITYLYDGPLGGTAKADAKINEMLARNVDLIYSLTTPASKKLNEALAGKKVPGVFGPVFDPVESGIVAALARPGGRLTGVRVRGSTPKALEWLLSIVPGVKRIYVPFHVTDDAACATLTDLRETAAKFNIRIITENVTTAQELEKALANIPADADALWLTCSELLYSNVGKIATAAASRKIPTASSTHSPYKDGILVSYGENDFVLGGQVSRLADKLLKGAPPESLPVETAEYTLGINLQTARTIGITVPADIIKQADFLVR